MSQARDVRKILFVGANIFSSLYEALENVEKGQDLVAAGSHAIKNGRRRATLLQKAEVIGLEELEEGEGGVVIDAELEEP